MANYKTIADAPRVLNTNDQEMWLLGYNEALDAQEADAKRYHYLCEFKEWPEPVHAAIDFSAKWAIDEAIDAAIKEQQIVR